MSWIYHDSALEGTVYTTEELEGAFGLRPVADSSLLPVYDEIRQHRAAIALTREMATRKRLVYSPELLRELYLTLVPEEAETKGPLYRKDIPVHRLYFHEISPPDKIAPRLRQLTDWMNSPETRRSTHTVRLAAKAHFRFMQIFPFPRASGKVGRLLMNLVLLRQGYPPAIIHATERQRYYDALKTSSNATASLVADALTASIDSALRYLTSGMAASA
ncbi:MAG: Fic family protein [Myxococcota bacterium]|nr:Fic family protein [Myxococcota bacterium]MDW8362077.1 Fic family protein [Myxococcales bacterium]